MSILEILKDPDPTFCKQFFSERFSSNLSFFSRMFPHFSEVLNSRPKKYNLLLDRKGVNIIDLRNKSLIYPEMDGFYTMLEVHRELAKNPLSNDRWNIRGNEVILQPMDENMLPITALAVNRMIKNLQRSHADTRFYLGKNFFPNTVIYGLLGGIFLEILRENKAFFNALFLFEEDIDLFRISCYFLDYSKLFQQVDLDGFYLCVGDEIKVQSPEKFFNSRKITSNFMLLELQMYQSSRVKNLRDSLSRQFSMNKRGWGSFEDEMLGLKNSLKNRNYSILSCIRRTNIPICVVGNGPSLDFLLPFLKKIQDRVIIFSCGTALGVLKRFGINPDFQIEIERMDLVKNVLIEAPLEETPLLCGSMVSPSVLTFAQEAYIFLRGGSACSYLFDSNPIEYSSPFVGNAGVALAMQLSSEIFLCGLDCGYIEGMSKHAKNSFYGDEGIKIPKNAQKIPSNGKYDVFADSIFLLSIQNIESAISAYKPKIVFNLGEGAKIKGAPRMEVDRIKLKKIQKLDAINFIKSQIRTVELKREKDKILQEARVYLGDISSRLQHFLSYKDQSKKALFCFINSFCNWMFSKGVRDPFLAILFEGSIAHLVQTLMLCVLHLPSQDILAVYRYNIEVISWSFDRMLLSLESLILLQD